MAAEQLPLRLRPRGQQLAHASEARPRYFWVAPAEVTLADILRPDYWADVIHAFERRWTIVEVVAIDGSWEATLSALGITPDRAGVRMRIIASWQDEGEMPALPEGYEIILSDGWTVLDKRGGGGNAAVLAQGVASERLAREVAIDHARGLQRFQADAARLSHAR